MSRMGKIGPGENVPSSATLGSGGDQRPVVAIQGSMDAMSMVSEVSVDACFNASGEKVLPPPPGIRDDAALRFSNSMGSSQTNENKTLRQGAVDKMVMEALRQAQEARQSSHHDLGRRSRTPPDQSMPAPQSLHNSVPTIPGMTKGLTPPFTPGGQSIIKQTSVHQSSVRATPSPRNSRGSKSPHQLKPALKLPKQQKGRNKRSSRSGSGKGSGAGGPGSLHSFYSESQATSFDADDAFAC
jgi:hypothetical protein